ncbi:MAG: DUF2905 domain-containing protein [Anaerolineae bacterium]|nr:DUF2905 domain-containing protein [Anaerolineae bacterium]
MDLNILGRLIVFLGLGLVVLGGVLMLFARVPVLKNLGHLPGDIRYESGSLSCFFPIVSMIIISILLSVGLNLLLRLLNR